MTQEIEKTLWAAADKLRNNMDAAEYKHVVLGLIFLKYISDSFEEQYNIIKQDPHGDPEDKDEYTGNNMFYVPQIARWNYIQERAKSTSIGIDIDNAMEAIEKDNASLKGVLPKEYAKEALDKKRLGELVDLISNIGFTQKEHNSKDLLGRVYEYFLGKFADAEGKRGGQFYTPDSIVRLLVEMLEPYTGRIYDGCCGSGGMFVQSEKFIKAHGGRIDDVAIYGQESNPTTYKLAKMNLAIRKIDASKIELGDTFHNDKHPNLQVDYILANPPFNVSDWGGERLQDSHIWKYGVPPAGNANYAWLQLFISKLKPTGSAGIVLANGSMTTTAGTEGEIRKNLILAGVVDCMVALPSQLFYNTQIPACLWFLARDRKNHKFRNRSNEILFIDARKMGVMTSRKNKTLTDAEIARIAQTYHNWRNINGSYTDVQGFCKAATIEDVRANNFVLTPGRYVGTEDAEDDSIPFEEKIATIAANLSAYFEEANALQDRIKQNLQKIGIEL